MEEIQDFETRLDLSNLTQKVETLKKKVKEIIVGNDHAIDLILTAIISDGHVLIEGVPGVAKTLMVKLVAKLISSDFSRIQFTPDLMPSDILGTLVFNMKSSEFEYRKGPIFSNIVLIDEINRAPAKTQSSLFEVMEERQITNDGTTYQMSKPFIVFATQNPIEQEGTYKLPEAQLDRFLFKIVLPYPSFEEEIEVINRHNLDKNMALLTEISALLSFQNIEEYRNLAKQVYVDDKIVKYIASIIHQTRLDPMIFLGASPRASINVLNASKAFALLRNRDFVSPEDVKFIVPNVLRHRIILTAEAEMEGFNSDSVCKRILDTIEVPK
ncbi:MAG: MoxR family ATPase [Bacteroidota bacterium]